MAQIPALIAFSPNTTILSSDTNSNNTQIRTVYNAHDIATTGVHGVGAGAIVGTTLTQTLTNKTLTTPVIQNSLSIDAGTSIDPAIYFDADSGDDWYFGVDVTSSNRLMFGEGTSVGTNQVVVMNYDGSGGANWLQVINNQNTASSSAYIQMTVGGASAGDLYNRYTIDGVVDWTHGVSNADDNFYLRKSSTLSTTNYLCRFIAAGAGGDNEVTIYNESNTSSSNAILELRVGGSSAGDAYLTFSENSADTYSFGLDNSAGALRICNDNLLDSDYVVEIFQNNVNNRLSVYNSVNSAGANAYIETAVAGSSSGDPFFLLSVGGGGANWHIGIDNSDADKLKIGTGTTIGANTIIEAAGSPTTYDILFEVGSIANSYHSFVHDGTNTFLSMDSDTGFARLSIDSETGDAYVMIGDQSNRLFSIGTDATDGNVLKLTTGTGSTVDPSSGTTLWTYSPTATTCATLLFATGLTATSAAGQILEFNTGTSEIYRETSSARYKENIRELTNSLDEVCSLAPVIFDLKEADNGFNKYNHHGLIAEEVNEVFPYVVSKDSEGRPDGINYARLAPYIINALKEIKQRLIALEA